MSLFPDLVIKLRIQHDAALSSKDLVFTESQVNILEESGIKFEVRFAPSLAKKPTKGDPVEGKIDKLKTDPFAPPYIPNLFVTESKATNLQDGDSKEHVVLLNKFCVVPGHFLLVTRDFEPQNSLLAPSDLFAAFNILSTISKDRREPEHLAFFNCGGESGASQSHKHLQFIPLPDEGSPLAATIDEHRHKRGCEVFFLPHFPFANFIVSLSTNLSSKSSSEIKSILTQRYLSLLDAMVDHSRRLSSSANSPSPTKLSQMSYNLLMTESYIQLVPRSKEKWTPGEGGKDEKVEVSINSLGFAGMMLVKCEEELEAVKKAGVVEVLKGVTWPLLPDEDGEGEAS